MKGYDFNATNIFTYRMLENMENKKGPDRFGQDPKLCGKIKKYKLRSVYHYYPQYK